MGNNIPQGRDGIAWHKKVANIRGARKLKRSLKKFHLPRYVDMLFHKNNGLK